MSGHTTRYSKSGRDVLGLVAFLVLCLAVSGIGGAVTATSVSTWYPLLQQPPFNPPDWVFAPVWTALYLMMAVAAWRVWRHREIRRCERGLVLFALQLALNLLWSCLFFGWMAVGAALVEIVVLWVAIVATIVATAAAFGHIVRAAGWLMAPYAAWVLFPAVLNAAIWSLN